MNAIKRHTYYITILGLLLAANTLVAQPGPGGPPPIPSEKQVAAMVSELTNTLELTTAQARLVSTLYQDHFDKMRSDMNKSSRSGRPDRQTMERRRSNFDAAVKSVLNKQQIALYEAYLEENKPSGPPQRGLRR